MGPNGLTTPLLIAWAVTPPFFWAGLGLAAIPIVIHLLNRRRFRVVRWAAMEYLLAALRKNRRRLKFEQLVLLLTRCALLALLGLALARPRGCARSTIAAFAGQRSALHVFVIDNSYSMAYETERPGARTHLEQAKLLARRQIEKLIAGSESVAVVTAARAAARAAQAATPTALDGAGMISLRPTFDLEAARAAVDRIEQSFGGTDIAAALQVAAGIAREEKKQPHKYLHILTDCTRSAFENARAEVLQQVGRDLAGVFGGGRRIRLYNLGRDNQFNYAVTDVRPESGLVRAKLDSDFLAEVRGFGSGPEAVLQWKWDDRILPDSARLRPDTQTPPQRQRRVELQQGGVHVITATLVGNDRLQMDNARHRVVEVASEMKVLIVEGDRATGAASLELALAPRTEIGPTGAIRSDSYVVPVVISDLELSNKVLADYRAVILANVGAVNPAQADQLAAYVSRGGTLMVFMGEQVSTDTYNTLLYSRKLLPGKLVARKTMSAGGTAFTFDFRANSPTLHPLLGIFRGEEQCGLDNVPIEAYMQVDLDPQVRPDVVLRYMSGEKPTGDPAIVVHGLDRGRVVTVTTSASSEWNSLPQRPAYPVLVHELLAGTVDVGDKWMNLLVGQNLAIPPGLKLTAAPVLTDSAGRQIPLEATTGEDGLVSYRSRPIDRPGLYQLNTGMSVVPVAVNVPADEADARVLPVEAVRKALGEIDLAVFGDSLSDAQMARDEGSDLGWSLMAIVLLLAGLECFLAMKFGHQKRTMTAGSV